MARIRSIKPEFWESEQVGRLNWCARLTFVGLWSLADDEGRGRGHVDHLWGVLNRYTPLSMKGHFKVALRSLEAPDPDGIPLVVFYKNGQGPLADTYYWIPKFNLHQKIDKAQFSKLPPPPDTPEIRRMVATIRDKYPLDQGSGIRDQGSGRGREERGRGSGPADGPAAGGEMETTLDALEPYRVPGREKKREYVEDLNRQGVSHERIRAMARANSRVDFLALYRALKNGRAATAPASLLPLKPSGPPCLRCKAVGLVEATEILPGENEKRWGGCPVCKGSGVVPA